MVDLDLEAVVQMVGVKKRKIHIRAIEDDSIVETIETEYRTENYRKLIAGLERKVDLNRFYIDEEIENN